MRFPGVVWVLCGLLSSASALDREAFTFTNYDLNVRLEPAQQRLAVRGKVRLRNDSGQPQKNVVLQISSTLSWRAIKAGDKPLQFVSQVYTSDIDHTGALSEAIVTLAEAIQPKGTVELEIGYEGVIPPDATRLTRIGVPEDAAKHSDWDQISRMFTAVRGIGYVAWYPIATETASLSEGNSLFEAVGRWKAREIGASLRLRLTGVQASTEAAPTVLVNATTCQTITPEAGVGQMVADCTYEPVGLTVPAFVAANYSVLDQPTVRVYYLRPHKAGAEDYAQAAADLTPLITEWFGTPRLRAEVAELADPGVAPFESGNMLLTPLGSGDRKLTQLTLVHTLTHAAFPSSRAWIYEGLAHFAQALYRERQSGRQSALDYMGLHRAAFVEAQKQSAELKPETAASRSLINTASEEFYRSKAMYVWWTLRDMVGEPALKRALAAYRADQDKEPSYMQHLIEAQTGRDLEWFFDDWVYRDRGLPDFHVESAYPRKTMSGTYLVTVTVENFGAAGAEVPVTLRFEGGEVTRRLEVHGKAKGVIRIEIPSAPQEVIVNDGSVPESDLSNNVYKVKVEGEPK